MPDGPVAFLTGMATSGSDTLRWAGLAFSADAKAAGQADKAARLVREALETAGPAAVAVFAVGSADRWGRVPVLAVAGPMVLNAVLLREGLAPFVPGDLPIACARTLLAAEDDARRAGRGIWSAAGQAPFVDASAPDAILARSGLLTVVEGRVVGLGQSRTRIYLNFGTVRSQDFAVSILKRNLRKFEASGMTWTSWEGRRIRVRGVVVPAGGPLIEVSAPESIERLD